MKKIFLSAFSLFLGLVAIEVLIVFVSYTRAQAAIINVPDDKPTIKDAIATANNGDTIIVGIGTYYENINFLGKAITVRSTNYNDPDVVKNTIIDGNQVNSVVTFNTNEGNNSELSGFTIQNGKVDLLGAGINCVNSSPNIHHCIIRNNRHFEDSGGGGAGIACTQSSPNIHDCTIINNTSDYGNGAGIYCDNSSPVRIVTCIIRNNSVTSDPGGGVYLNDSDVYIEECNISYNKAFWGGGGIMCNGNSSLTIDNCLISNNIATVAYGYISYGGGIYCGSSSLDIINCTLSDNSAASNGGGIYYSNPLSNITNCIIWDNIPDGLYILSTPISFNVTYSCIQGGYTGTGNINADPDFVNPNPSDPNDADYHLLPNSPCIDSCNPKITDPCGGIDFDLDHKGRPQDGDNNGSCIFDMGAYEFCPDPDGDGLCGTYDICPNDPNNDPNAPEICDGKDNDCDGQIDEDFNVGASCDGTGACGIGVTECADPNTTRCSTDPGGTQDQSTSEICDGLDNDCDGQIDEDFNVGASCDGTGACGTGIIECADPNTTRCSTDPGGTQDQSTSEFCDGLDNDCDGQTDEGFNIGASCDGTGACGTGVIECADPNTTRCSTDPGGSQDQSTSEFCDGIDNDCDGTIDEDFMDTDNDGTADCIDECPNDPNNNCIDYSIHIEPHTMKLISFLHRPDDPVATSVFGDEVRENYCPLRFKIGTYDPEIGNYIEYGANLIVEPGRSYWCYARYGLDIVFNDVIPVSTDDNEVELLFDSNTNDGWNMIACPYNTNYLWDDVQVWGCDPNDPNAKTISELAMENDCNCIDRFLLWKWENGTWEDGTYVYYNPDPNSTCGNEPNEYDSDSDPNMRPNVGYWVNVKRENVHLRFPPLNMPRVKDSHNDVLIADITSQVEKSPSASRKPITATVGDSPPAPLGGFRPNGDRSSEKGSGGCFINNIFFGLPKYTR